ncbi:MAG TPA: hypothetical protein EYP53_09045 [Candidatus Latescibacteria bacterium]|nr:hypothetical protein [Candidatus Latescibacterota bacterium]
MKKPDILAAVEPVVKAFEKLGATYYIGGSVASSAFGVARATLDVDVVADLKLPHVKPLVEALKPEYYIDEDMILDAIHRRSSFNLIHLETMIKVDVFIIQDDSYHWEAFKRKRKETLDEERDNLKFYLASPEDIILNKLDWFRKGGGLSDQHWRDVLGVMKVQAGLLDIRYLQNWASELGLSDLLNRAFRDVGIQLS